MLISYQIVNLAQQKRSNKVNRLSSNRVSSLYLHAYQRSNFIMAAISDIKLLSRKGDSKLTWLNKFDKDGIQFNVATCKMISNKCFGSFKLVTTLCFGDFKFANMP